MRLTAIKQAIALFICRLFGIDPQAEINRRVTEQALAYVQCQLKVEGTLSVVDSEGNLK